MATMDKPLFADIKNLDPNGDSFNKFIEKLIEVGVDTIEGLLIYTDEEIYKELKQYSIKKIQMKRFETFLKSARGNACKRASNIDKMVDTSEGVIDPSVDPSPQERTENTIIIANGKERYIKPSEGAYVEELDKMDVARELPISEWSYDQCCHAIDVGIQIIEEMIDLLCNDSISRKVKEKLEEIKVRYQRRTSEARQRKLILDGEPSIAESCTTPRVTKHRKTKYTSNFCDQLSIIYYGIDSIPQNLSKFTSEKVSISTTKGRNNDRQASKAMNTNDKVKLYEEERKRLQQLDKNTQNSSEKKVECPMCKKLNNEDNVKCEACHTRLKQKDQKKGWYDWNNWNLNIYSTNNYRSGTSHGKQQSEYHAQPQQRVVSKYQSLTIPNASQFKDRYDNMSSSGSSNANKTNFDGNPYPSQTSPSPVQREASVTTSKWNDISGAHTANGKVIVTQQSHFSSTTKPMDTNNLSQVNTNESRHGHNETVTQTNTTRYESPNRYKIDKSFQHTTVNVPSSAASSSTSSNSKILTPRRAMSAGRVTYGYVYTTSPKSEKSGSDVVSSSVPKKLQRPQSASRSATKARKY